MNARTSSLYAQFMKEREDKETYETDEGFITYSIDGDECYIETVYVIPIYRRLNMAANMANHVADIARKAGCKFLSGTVDPTTNGATSSMKTLLAYGFRLHSLKDGTIVLVKHL